MKPALFNLLFVLLAVMNVQADDRLLDNLNDDHARGTDLWIYNNLSEAKAQARRENKPIFVTFRCVPCRDCKGFDAEVAAGADEIATLAKENFIPIRQVEMKGVDLNQFQFDYDLNWAAMFINADGTVYARYGTQSAEGADAYNSTTGLKATMKRVLELHKNYPSNQDSLKDKKGAPRAYSTALEMPGMEKTATLAGLTSRENCIHCHMLHDSENRHAQETGTFTFDSLFRFPLPQNVGLNIVRDHGSKIESISAGSAAADSKLKPDEEIVTINGQAIASVADIQWVLHNLPNEDVNLNIVGSKSGPSTLSLRKGWKETDPTWRGSLHSVKPQFPIWTPPADDKQRTGLGLSDDQGALVVKYIAANKKTGQNAQKAGLKIGDILVEMDGKPIGNTPQKWQYQMKLKYKTGDTLPLTIIRNGKRIPIQITLAD